MLEMNLYIDKGSKMYTKLLLTFFLTTLSTVSFSSESCVDQAIEKLGLNKELKTDSKIFNDVLTNEMFLGDFKQFKPKGAEGESLNPLVERVSNAIKNRHVGIKKFLCKAIEEKIFAPTEKDQKITYRMLHHIFILQQLVENMVADRKFLSDLKDYFVEKRDIGDSFLEKSYNVFKVTGGLFETAKLVTVDLVINQYLDWRERGDLTAKDLKGKNRGLMANLLEATLTDTWRRNFDNAKAGVKLTQHLTQKLWVNDENEVVQEMVNGWSPLYETWNLAFVIGNLDDLQLFLPKLLIPEVIDAPEEIYLYKRGITLWVTANIVLLNLSKETVRDSIGPYPQAARVWGSINKEQAKLVPIKKD